MDETSYLRSRRLAGEASGKAAPGGLPVKLKLIDEPKFSHTGTTDFVDNAIDRASGTIRARAEFANPDGTLTPGMFGRIQVPAGPPSDAMLLPEVAVGTEQVRKFVLVVDGDNIARPKYVTLGPVVEDQRVITSGLDPDDRVIVNGLMRARPGVKVAPQEATAANNTSSFAGGAEPAAN
jgi:RND family efflux transporter MFP subunit